MRSVWATGRRPPVLTPESIRAYKGVSVALTLDQLADKVRAFPRIGNRAAELEVPDSVERDGPGRDGHMNLIGVTPLQLCRYYVATHPLPRGRSGRVRR
jgi:hypothetical protein